MLSACSMMGNRDRVALPGRIQWALLFLPVWRDFAGTIVHMVVNKSEVLNPLLEIFGQSLVSKVLVAKPCFTIVSGFILFGYFNGKENTGKRNFLQVGHIGMPLGFPVTQCSQGLAFFILEVGNNNNFRMLRNPRVFIYPSLSGEVDFTKKT